MSDVVTAALIRQSTKVSKVTETNFSGSVSASYSTIASISGAGFLYTIGVSSNSPVTNLRVTVDGGTPTVYPLTGLLNGGSIYTGGVRLLVFDGQQFSSSLLVEATGTAGTSRISIIRGEA